MANDILKFCCSDYEHDYDYDKVVQQYIVYYHRRAVRCKWEYYILNTIKFIIIAGLPVFQVVGIADKFKWSVTAASSAILLLESFTGMVHFKDKWILYRNTCNQLMSIQRKHYFYEEDKIDDCILQYMQEVESVIGEEAKIWYDTSSKSKEKKNQKT